MRITKYQVEEQFRSQSEEEKRNNLKKILDRYLIGQIEREQSAAVCFEEEGADQ